VRGAAARAFALYGEALDGLSATFSAPFPRCGLAFAAGLAVRLDLLAEGGLLLPSALP